ncbi:MAG: DUF86 domain-containing protein [Selenomonadaceae bacterium]|nr:DUF86 domain-containing protein [Selenomonadaceae bacterium]
MQRRDKITLQKIVSEIDIILNFLEDMNLEEFLNDEKTKRAVGMTAINIGELTKNLSDEIRKNYQHISWKDAARFRDVVAHKYETLDMEDVFKTVTEDFPKMKMQIEQILSDET